MVEGYSPGQVHTLLKDGLIGQTITVSSGGITGTLTLKRAEDPMNPTVGTMTNADGGVAIQLLSATSTTSGSPVGSGESGASGYSVQYSWRYTFAISLSYDVSGDVPDWVADSSILIGDAFLTLVRSTLQPYTGRYVSISGYQRQPARRDPVRPAFMVETVTVTMECPW